MNRARAFLLFLAFAIFAAAFAYILRVTSKEDLGHPKRTEGVYSSGNAASNPISALNDFQSLRSPEGSALSQVERDDSRQSVEPDTKFLLDIDTPMIARGELRDASIKVDALNRERAPLALNVDTDMKGIDVSSLFDLGSQDQGLRLGVSVYSLGGALLDRVFIAYEDFIEEDRSDGKSCFRASLLLRGDLSEVKVVGVLKGTDQRPIVGACVALLEPMSGGRPRALTRAFSGRQGQFVIYIDREAAGLLVFVSDRFLPKMTIVDTSLGALIDLGALSLHEGFSVSGSVRGATPGPDGEEFQVVLQRSVDGHEFEIEGRRLVLEDGGVSFVGATIYSGSDGRFECHGLTADEYEIFLNGASRDACSLAGWYPTIRSVQPPTSAIHLDVNRPLLRWRVISNEQSLVGASISLHSDSGRLQCVTGKGGRARVFVNDSELIHVGVNADGFWPEQLVFDVASQMSSSEIVVELDAIDRGADLHLTAVSSTGQPIDGVIAELFEVSGSDQIPIINLHARDVTGKYRWTGLRPGEYDVLFRGDIGGSDSALVPVTRRLLLDQNSVIDERIVMDVGGRVKVRIQDKDGYASTASFRILDSLDRRVNVTFSMVDRSRSFAHTSRDKPHPKDAKRGAFADVDGALPSGDYTAVVFGDEGVFATVPFSVVIGETCFVAIDLPDATEE